MPFFEFSLRSLLRLGLLATIISLVLWVIFDFQHIVHSLVQFTKWVSKHPEKGPLSIAGVYILAETLFLPRSVLSIGVGFTLMKAYGNVYKTLYIGIPLITFAASISSIIHFNAGRFIFSQTARNLGEQYPIFKAIDKAMLSDGLLLMILLHMSPMIPFSILNFVVGMTAMK